MGKQVPVSLSQSNIRSGPGWKEPDKRYAKCAKGLDYQEGFDFEVVARNLQLPSCLPPVASWKGVVPCKIDLTPFCKRWSKPAARPTKPGEAMPIRLAVLRLWTPLRRGWIRSRRSWISSRARRREF